MSIEPSLPLIIGLARAGAIDHAWRLFRSGGFSDETGDPKALAVLARLLKDRAAAAHGEARRRLYRKSAAAYARAAALSPASYPLINAASLYLLADDPAEARRQAGAVLDLIDAEPDEPETPYWRAATRAEALLLLDRHDEARLVFAEAIAVAPHAWEDHASTLRQFALILDAQGKDAAWLDSHRPPRSVHFGGHMSFDPKVVRREHLDEKIAAALDDEHVGFGYGALAAGADIIIAEALLERGAELHAVLPGGAESFASVSVDPLGKAWRRRFDAVLARAATVRAVRPQGVAPDRMTIGLADEIAMGAAIMNARRLESRALQLLVLDQGQATPADSEGPNGHGRWVEAGWRQRIITAPREALPAGPPPPLPTRAHARLALLAIGLGPMADRFEDRLAELADMLRQAPQPSVAPFLVREQVLLAYAEVVDAARAAVALGQAMTGANAPGIGGHYGIADPFDDPFSGQVRLLGDPAELAAAAAASAPPGSICVTEDFAAALAASNAADLHSELIGELEARGGGGAPVALYAVKPR